jgi:gas vesicle protein
MNSGKVVLGVLAGVAAGAILGILFAPAKGSDTRKKITKTGSDAADSVKDKFNEFLDTMSEKYESVKENIIEYAEEHRTKSENSK